MSVFFLRNAYVTIFPAGSSNGIKIGGNKLNPFKIKFEVEKWSNTGEGSTGKIDLYNISDTNIANIRTQGTTVRLNAGYGDDTPMLCFGTAYVAPTRLEGSDHVTSIEIIEAGLAFDQTTVSLNLGPNSTNQQAMTIILNQLYAAGIVKGLVQSLPQLTFNKGLHFSGMAKNILYRLCHQVNYTFAISNGVIDVVPRSVGTNNQVFLLSPTSGLIGIPTPNVESIGDFSMYEFKSLLNARLSPTNLIKVQSKYVKNGFYQIFSIKHTGDTLEGSDYCTKIQAFYVKT